MQDNSNMFKVDHSQEYQYQSKQTKLDHFFYKDKKILNDGQPRKVLFGPMEQEQRTIYQVVKPYFWKVASATGQAATVAGKGIYEAVSNGVQWVYDKLVNKVIPYTAEQIPKLLFIIKNSVKKQNIVNNSESFHVLQIDQDDYEKIKNKQAKKNKKRVIVPLGANQDPAFIKFLEQQNYVPDTSFKIGQDSDEQQQTFMVPSATFMVKHNQALMKNLPQNQKQAALEQYESEQIKIQNKEEKINQQQEVTQQNQLQIKSIIEKEQKQKVKQVENYKKAQKKYIKLKDCFIFELQGKNSIEYDLLDGIQKDDNTKCGYLIKSTKFNIQNQDPSGGYSGEVPLLIQKTVDKNIKVRVQIPNIENTYHNSDKKIQQKQLSYA